MADLLKFLLQHFDACPTVSDSSEELTRLGAYLRALSQESMAHRNKLMIEFATGYWAHQHHRLALLLNESGERPAQWAKDVRTMMDQLRERAQSSEPPFPIDTEHGEDAVRARMQFWSAVESYGSLLEIWSALHKEAINIAPHFREMNAIRR